MQDIEQQLQQLIDHKTKPVGSLGQLEALACQIGKIQHSLAPALRQPTILVFAGDHGATVAGISAYPQEVTFQMVMNFLNGGAGINVFCRHNGLDLKVVDAGVNFDFPDHPLLIDAKVRRSTRNYLDEPALTGNELQTCLQRTDEIVTELATGGCNIVGLGDMGIGNTASASLIMSTLCNIPIAQCTGRGAGLDDAQFAQKIDLLQQAQARYPDLHSAQQILQHFGGYEIAMIAGAMLSAYRHRMIIMVDGFIATAAYLAAVGMKPEIADNAIFCHLSDERGHIRALEFIGAVPLLKLSMRLGEGTGCALAYPLIRCAVGFMNEMASFDSARVSSQK